MTQLLIVDDEPLAIRSVVNSVNWESIGITRVFTANNASQAREIYAQYSIDVMLCDIEMPRESGIELLAWVREHSPVTESIFLTCHADFNFAKKAIQLGSLDYLLKPIPPDELESAIRKAVQQIKSEHKLRQQSKSWVKHHPLFIERFWSDIITRTIPSTPAAIRAAAQERNIYIPEDFQVLPVLIQVRRWHKPLSHRDKKIMEFALMNAFREIAGEYGESAETLPVEEGRLLAVLYEVKSGPAELTTLLETYIASCRKFFYCDLTCYIGASVSMEELPELKRRLGEWAKDNIASDNQVLTLREEYPARIQLELPDMKVWSVMIREGLQAKLFHEADQYLEKLKSTRGLSARDLHRFVQDLLQMVYSILQDKGIQAHQLFQDPTSIDLLEHATDSVAELKDWISHLLGKALGYAAELEEAEPVVNKVKAYITQNLGQELNRESIAGQFYLHPDYINRLFKKETGQSMTEYLLQERMSLATELLVKTKLPVTTIAANIGYTNLSHFAKLFRKCTGINPNEYRQLKQGSGRS
ncbi:response regulator [Paenibacillus sp. MMS20-IR301]|uniref:response regulator transcription factor n=1 Tax=Paenibacillus sp. MMS20-IR301 TaxID=2895946 RepID=UPI0028E3A6BD|nr:response regulator [Paenibacillus sp. MMS20-IR301]WNS41829.1 response regulator [Paenibacillus sp. MMS20-IR301]